MKLERVEMTRKDHIVETAKRLFAEKGFSGTGLREIADTAGVSIGNIYNYFKNKEEIFKCIFDGKDILASLAPITELLKEGFPFNLDKIILVAKQAIDENFELYSLIFIDLIEFDGVHSNRILEMVLEFSDKIFSERLSQNSLIGTVLRDADYGSLIRVFVVSIISSFLTRKILPASRVDNASDEDMVKMISDVVLHGILI